jgi:hypothetical protein
MARSHRSIQTPFVLFVFLVAALAAAPALWAQGQDLDETPGLRVVQQGKGWYLLEALESEKTAEPGPLFWMVTEEGLDTVPLAPMWRDDLAAEFSGEAAVSDGPDIGSREVPPGWVVLDAVALHFLEQGTIPPGYESYYEVDDTGQFSCGDKNKEKHKHWQVDRETDLETWPLGGGIQGTLSAGFPVQIDAHLYIRYKIKRKLCIPYGVSFRNLQIVGVATMAGQTVLSAGLSYQHEWTREWPLLDVYLGTLSFWVGPIPVWISFDFDLDVGLDVEVEVDAEVGLESDVDATVVFDYTCTKHSCTGSNTFINENGSNQGGFYQITGGLEANLVVQAWVRPGLHADLYRNPWIDILKGGIRLKGLLYADLWGYYGNNCGDADSDGHNETVKALAADFGWGYDTSWYWSFFGHGNEHVDEGPRHSLGWWDLLDRLGQGKSTALQPMLLGPSEVNLHGPGTWRVKMRPCYPYDKRVDFTVAPGFPTSSGSIPSPKSTDPNKNSVEVGRYFHSAGPKTLTVTATEDDEGRELDAPYSRTIQVISPAPPPPPPPPPAPEIRVVRVGGGEVPDGGTYAFGPVPLANLPVSQEFRIHNDGTADLTISNPSSLVTGTGFSQIGNPPAAVVSPGGSTTFRVRFHVGQAGAFDGAVEILNNDADEGQYDVALSGSALAPCVPTTTRFCLRGTRFAVDLTYSGGAASARPYTPLSGFFTFANPDNLEVGVKILQPPSGPWWVFHGPATAHAYTLTVFDTQTGAVRTYVKPASSLCGHADTTAFPALLTPEGLADRSVGLPPWEVEPGASGPGALANEAFDQALAPFPEAGTLPPRAGSCVTGPTSVCLNGGRFQVEVLKGGTPQPADGLTPLSGVFTFANPDNVEVVVKVLGPATGQYWVFYSSLSHQSYEVRVTDTATGTVRTYANPAGTYCGVADTDAF